MSEFEKEMATGIGALRKNFIEPPFSTLNARTWDWQTRKKFWLNLGIKSECGRIVEVFSGTSHFNGPKYGKRSTNIRQSIFDPVLCELMYTWFCPAKGSVLDPFAGGSVRGIVSNYLDFQYTGIELSEIQVNANKEQSLKILKPENQPNWIVGDSNVVLNQLEKEFDFLFSCPPYYNLEVYSKENGDISNISTYEEFLKIYKEIIQKSCNKLKSESFAVFVVGEVRDKKGNYIGFVPDTIKAFMDCGMKYYNEIILQTMCGTAALRANLHMKSKKIVKVHQNVLVFKKP